MWVGRNSGYCGDCLRRADRLTLNPRQCYPCPSLFSLVSQAEASHIRGAPVKKHLLSLALLAGTVAGCQQTKPTVSGVPEPLPAQSFKRDWAANLQLNKDDSIDRVFVREDLVFVYSKKHNAYAVNK